MACDCSRHIISLLIWGPVTGDPAVWASTMSLWRYRIETSGSLKAAFIMLDNTSGPAAMRAAANGGLVDHTREETVGERGRKAIGPVGKNLWYAVVLGPWNAPRGEWTMVATMA